MIARAFWACFAFAMGMATYSSACGGRVSEPDCGPLYYCRSSDACCPIGTVCGGDNGCPVGSCCTGSAAPSDAGPTLAVDAELPPPFPVPQPTGGGGAPASPGRSK